MDTPVYIHYKLTVHYLPGTSDRDSVGVGCIPAEVTKVSIV